MKQYSRNTGFTLIELIVIIILLGIVGSFVITFMGTKIFNAPDVALTARRETLTERVMERIMADYLVQINGPAPDGALAAIAGVNGANATTYEALDPNGEIDVQFDYLTFSAAGAETLSATPTNTLKVTITIRNNDSATTRVQNRLVTLLTHARTTAGTANEPVVNY